MREYRRAGPLRAGGPPCGAPTPLPARAVATFAARYGLTVEAIAARLGLEAAQLVAFDQAGGPGWLRLALMGVAVERGVRPAALAWLMDTAGPPAASDTTRSRESGRGPVEAPG